MEITSTGHWHFGTLTGKCITPMKVKFTFHFHSHKTSFVPWIANVWVARRKLNAIGVSCHVPDLELLHVENAVF
jgi:hypothetical protein